LSAIENSTAAFIELLTTGAAAEASVTPGRPLRPLGIDKGKPFAPDARQTKLLTDGAFIGQKIAIANFFEKRFSGSPYRAGAHWDHVVNVDPSQEAKYYSELDERSAWFYEAVTLSAGMASKVAGLGQAYLGAYQDKEATGSTAPRRITCACRRIPRRSSSGL
jgi:hypothetical protein